MQQTAPLKLPPNYQERPSSYFYDKYLWTKQGIENDWLESVTVTELEIEQKKEVIV